MILNKQNEQFQFTSLYPISDKHCIGWSWHGKPPLAASLVCDENMSQISVAQSETCGNSMSLDIFLFGSGTISTVFSVCYWTVKYLDISRNIASWLAPIPFICPIPSGLLHLKWDNWNIACCQWLILKCMDTMDWYQTPINMMTSSNGNIFRVTGPLCGQFTGVRRIPLT